MIYLDSSALVKLALAERESESLTRWLSDRPNTVRVSSSIIRVEVPRAVWRADPTAVPESYQLITRMREIVMTDAVLARAAALRPASIRSIDAIHLASALSIQDILEALVAYDKRLLAAAQEAGLPVASPA